MSINIRPHHLLDILRDFGHGVRYQPHEYGHALHLVAEEILSNPDREIVLVIAVDDICRPCRHLHPDGQCVDTMTRGNEVISKQIYNDDLDQRIWAFLELDKENRMTVREFCRRVYKHLDGIEAICTHPGEDRLYRRTGLIEGIKKLGIDGLD